MTATCEGDTLQQAVDYAAYTCSLYVSLLRVLLLRYASMPSIDLTISSSCVGYRYSGHDDRLACGDDIHSGTGEYRSYRTDHRQDPGHFQDRHHRKYPAGSLVSGFLILMHIVGHGRWEACVRCSSRSLSLLGFTVVSNGTRSTRKKLVGESTGRSGVRYSHILVT